MQAVLNFFTRAGREIMVAGLPLVCYYPCFTLSPSHEEIRNSRARILVQVTIYQRHRIGRDGQHEQSDAYDIS